MSNPAPHSFLFCSCTSAYARLQNSSTLKQKFLSAQSGQIRSDGNFPASVLLIQRLFSIIFPLCVFAFLLKSTQRSNRSPRCIDNFVSFIQCREPHFCQIFYRERATLPFTTRAALCQLSVGKRHAVPPVATFATFG